MYSTVRVEKFQICGAHIPRKCIELGIFTHAPFSTQNIRQNLLKICFPQQQEGMEKTIIWFIQIQAENMKMIRWYGALAYLYFVWFVLFLNAWWLYGFVIIIYPVSCSVVLSLLPLYCYQDNLTPKLHQTK